MRVERESIKKNYYISTDLEEKQWNELYIRNISGLMGLVPQDIRFRFLRSRNLSLSQMNCISEFIMVFNEYGYKKAYYYLFKFIDLADKQTKYLTSVEMLTLYSMIIVLFKNTAV